MTVTTRVSETRKRSFFFANFPGLFSVSFRSKTMLKRKARQCSHPCPNESKDMNDGPAPSRANLAHPLIRGALIGFLSASQNILIGRMDEYGAVIEGNPALEARLVSSRHLRDALRRDSEGKWREVLAAVQRGGDNREWTLEFGGESAERARFRGMLYREGPDLWLFAERTTSDCGDWVAEVLDLHVELARLNRTFYRRTVELERANAEVGALARTDPLTGLANRRQGDSWMRMAVDVAREDSTPLGCIMVDIDGFKAINDMFGHPVGDLALIETARLLAEGVRPSDRVIRLGGDEFLILAPGADVAGAGILAERLRQVLVSRAIEPIGRGLTAGFGVAALRDGEMAGELVRRADEALLRAKAAGRNRVEVDS